MRMRDTKPFQITVDGHLDDRWQAVFDDMVLERTEEGSTIIRGVLADQAALYGILGNIRDYGMTLRAVNLEGKP